MTSSIDLTPEQKELLCRRLEALLSCMDQDHNMEITPAKEIQQTKNDNVFAGNKGKFERVFYRVIREPKNYYKVGNVIYLESALKLKESTEQALHEMKNQNIKKETVLHLRKQCNEFVKEYGGLITITATLAAVISSAKDVLEALKIID